MMESSAQVMLRFGNFVLDRGRGCLRDSSGEEIPLRPKSFDLLQFFVQNAGQMLKKGTLLDAGWPNVHVTEGSIAQCVRDIRRALRDENGSMLRTVARKGYIFDAEVREERDETTRARDICYNYMASSESRLAFSSSAPSQDDDAVRQQSRRARRLAIVVLPFRNIDEDAQGNYLAEGITENVTTELARVWDMLVIAHRSASMYGGRIVSALQIGRELDVRYILEGSVQRSGAELLVNARLVDAGSDSNIWTERHRGDPGDPFLLQEVITNRVVSALTFNIIARESAGPLDRLDAFEHTLIGRAALGRPISAENYNQAIAAFEKALTVDPRFVQAKIFLALALANRLLDRLSTTRDSDVERVKVLIEEARLVAPTSVLLHFAKAQLLRATARCDEAITEYETVLMLNRNWPTALAAIGGCKLYAGPLDDVIPLEEQAIRLSPRDPSIGFWYFWIGLAHLLQTRTDKALVWFQKGISAAPGLGFIHLYLASAYGLKEELQAAREQLAHLPYESSLSVGRMRGDIARNVKDPEIMAAYEHTLIAGWRKVGLPEE